MKSSWTNGLKTDQEKDEIKSSFSSSGRLRSRLTEVLRKKQELVRKERLQDDLYSSPGWGLLQADAVGYQRALEEIIDLLTD